MPWLRHVAAVLEAWYPGQEAGAAIAQVLSGRVDPSGRLPITFPASENEMPETSARMFPGVDGNRRLWFEPRHRVSVVPSDSRDSAVRLRLRTRLHELRSVRSADYRVDEWRRSPGVSHERGRSEW